MPQESWETTDAEERASASPEWRTVVEAGFGQVFVDAMLDERFRGVILRGTRSLCGYVGVRASDPLAGWPHHELQLAYDRDLTYSDFAIGLGLDSSWWWYGTDYAARGDRRVCSRANGITWEGETRWIVALVREDLDRLHAALRRLWVVRAEDGRRGLCGRSVRWQATS